MTGSEGREIEIEGVDPRELYGPQDAYLERIKELHPTLKIIARGSTLKVLGSEAETARFARRIESLVACYLKYCHISALVVDQCFSGSDMPAVESGEKLGFLPGDMKEKLDPYLQPLYDALNDMIPPAKLAKYLEEGTVQIAPLAYMRGRTLDNAFVILDEAQNTTLPQIKMFLTRMGRNARFIVTGDVTQIDLPRRSDSGLVRAMEILRPVKGIGCVEFNKDDIVRHELVKQIVEAFDRAAAVE